MKKIERARILSSAACISHSPKKIDKRVKNCYYYIINRSNFFMRERFEQRATESK